MAHRTVNAKEIAKDIKDGMSLGNIKAKYQLWDGDIQKVTGRLLEHNMITDDDIGRMMGSVEKEHKDVSQINEPITADRGKPEESTTEVRELTDSVASSTQQPNSLGWNAAGFLPGLSISREYLILLAPVVAIVMLLIVIIVPAMTQISSQPASPQAETHAPKDDAGSSGSQPQHQFKRKMCELYIRFLADAVAVNSTVRYDWRAREARLDTIAVQFQSQASQLLAEFPKVLADPDVHRWSQSLTDKGWDVVRATRECVGKDDPVCIEAQSRLTELRKLCP